MRFHRAWSASKRPIVVTAYKKTPGYAEQQATLETQRIFTLIIGVLVMGGFFQIQMLQKVPQIGMLKAIGARNRTVAVAVILQVTLVTMHRRGDWHGADAAAGGELPGRGADCVSAQLDRHRDCARCCSSARSAVWCPSDIRCGLSR